MMNPCSWCRIQVSSRLWKRSGSKLCSLWCRGKSLVSGWDVNFWVKETGQVWRCFEGVEKGFMFNSFVDQMLVEMLQNGVWHTDNGHYGPSEPTEAFKGICGRDQIKENYSKDSSWKGRVNDGKEDGQKSKGMIWPLLLGNDWAVMLWTWRRFEISFGSWRWRMAEWETFRVDVKVFWREISKSEGALCGYGCFGYW